MNHPRYSVYLSPQRSYTYTYTRRRRERRGGGRALAGLGRVLRDDLSCTTSRRTPAEYAPGTARIRRPEAVFILSDPETLPDPTSLLPPDLLLVLPEFLLLEATVLPEPEGQGKRTVEMPDGKQGLQGCFEMSTLRLLRSADARSQGVTRASRSRATSVGSSRTGSLPAATPVIGASEHARGPTMPSSTSSRRTTLQLSVLVRTSTELNSERTQTWPHQTPHPSLRNRPPAARHLWLWLCEGARSRGSGEPGARARRQGLRPKATSVPLGRN